MSLTSCRVRKKKRKLSNKMFFVLHHLCCLFRNGENPDHTRQIVTMKWKNWTWGEKSTNITSLSGFFSCSSLLPVILISPAVYLLFHSWAFSEVNQNFKFQENIQRWKTSRPCSFSGWDDLHCSFISANTQKSLFCVTQHIKKLVSGQDGCHSSMVVCIFAKIHWAYTFN